MDDRDLIDLFFKRDEQAIVSCSERYGHWCFTVAWNILFDREDSEECVNDTWNTAWNTIPPKRPEKLKYYLAKITRGFALNRLRSDTRQKRGGGEYEQALEELEYSLHTDRTPEQELMASGLTEILNRFLKKQPERDRNVFIRRYFYLESGRQIAKRYGLSESNVNVILNRVRTKLKAVLQEEGYI